MSSSITAAPRNRRRGRSAMAIIVGFLAVAVLSTVTDQILHSLGVYPPWGVTMSDPRLFLLALGYRIVFTIFGGWLAARLAPYGPMRHAIVLGVIGTVVAAIGLAITIGKPELGPAWYPIALVVTALPCTWLGGALYRARTS